MSTEQDLVKGKDTMVPLVDFQEKKRTGWRQLKISSSGVVQYLSDACYTTIKTLPILCLLIQVILLGDCRWCVCSAFNTKIIARYPGCCGKHDNSSLSASYFVKTYWQNSNLTCSVTLQMSFRLVAFILACSLKFSMILEILAHWIIWSTAYFHCLGSTLSQTCIMHKYTLVYP